MSDEAESGVLRVLTVHGETLNRNLAKANASGTKADTAICDAQRLLEKLGKAIPERNRPELMPFPKETPRLRTWEEIVAEARVEQPGKISFANILDPHEMAEATSHLSRWNSEFAGLPPTLRL